MVSSIYYIKAPNSEVNLKSHGIFYQVISKCTY